jgi:hypothetical protein
MKRAPAIGGIVILASLAAAPAIAAPPVAQYSSLCTSQATGDVMGRRMAVARFGNDTYVIFQMGEGGLLDPEFVKANFNPATGALSFKLKYGNQTVKGVVSNEAFVYMDYSVRTVLPRQSDFEAQLPPCR